MKIKLLVFFLSLFIAQNCNSQRTEDYQQNRTKGNGQITRELRQVSAYTGISQKSIIDVVLTDGKVGDVTVEAELDLIDFVDVQTINGTLQIGFKKKENIGNMKEITVYVPVDDNLRKIVSSGTGNITSKKDLKGAELSVISGGTGNVTLKNVNIKNFGALNQGTGNLKIGNINSAELKLDFSGTGNFLTETLTADETKISISGTGNANFKGKTDNLKIINSGTGSVNARNLTADHAQVWASGTGSVYVNAQKTLSVDVGGTSNVYYTGSAAITEIRTTGLGKIKKL
ncbi:MAG: DUF2807 domain-containing protein [Flavobacteriaceae bacterium]|jgi:hypothetical protein|nr:DUF2807 domain-containing protein [Flavobacteriaceae bacterium]